MYVTSCYYHRKIMDHSISIERQKRRDQKGFLVLVRKKSTCNYKKEEKEQEDMVYNNAVRCLMSARVKWKTFITF